MDLGQLVIVQVRSTPHDGVEQFWFQIKISLKSGLEISAWSQARGYLSDLTIEIQNSCQGKRMPLTMRMGWLARGGGWPWYPETMADSHLP